MNSKNNVISHPHGSPLSFAAQPQMSVFHEKLDSVLLRRDWIIFSKLDHPEIGYMELIAANTAFILMNFSRNLNRALLLQLTRRLEDRLRNIVCGYNALAYSTPVPHLHKMNGLAVPYIINPPFQRYCFLLMTRQTSYICHSHNNFSADISRL